MSFLKSLFKGLTAGPEAAGKVLDATISGVDAIVFTDEEKQAAHQKALDHWLELMKLMGEETTVRAITRRILAILVMVPYVVFNLLAVAVYPWWPDYANFIFSVINDMFAWMALGVMCFYFGPYFIKQMIPGVKK